MDEEGLRLGLGKKSLWTFLSKIIIFLLRFPIGILTARYLGPEGKGFLYLLIVSVTISVALVNLGLGPASIYFIGKDRKHLPAILGNLLISTGITSIILCGAGWLFLQYGRPDIYALLPLWVWGIVALSIPIGLLRNLVMQVLAALLRIKAITIMEVAAKATQLFLIIFLVVMIAKGVEGAFLAYWFSECLAASGFFLLILHFGGWPARPNLALLAASLRFGVKPYLSNLMTILNRRLDVFLVAKLAASGVNATGIYSVAAQLAELVLFIPTSIRLTLFPMVAASSTAQANQLTSMACRHAMFLTTIVALGAAVVGPFLITQLYGGEFAAAVIPLLILLPGVIALSQTYIIKADLNGRGKPGVATLGALIALTVTIVLDLLLIPRYGIIGAAIASTCAYTIEFVVVTSYFIRYTGLTWCEALLFGRSDLDRYLEFYNPQTADLVRK